jgi:microcystin degradation protein MlrC
LRLAGAYHSLGRCKIPSGISTVRPTSSAAHGAFAESVAGDIWDRRHETLNDYLSVEAAAALAVAFDSGDGPLVIADYADNPGGGALLDAGVTKACFGPMVDGEAALALHACKIGDRVRIALGGKTDTRFGGEPLTLDAELVSKSDGVFMGDGPMMAGLRGTFGPSAVLRVDGIEILVVTIARQILDLQQFKSNGIDPAGKRVVALRSMQHFRAAFAPIAGKIIVCDSGALCTLHYERLPYRNVPRPIFPLDKEVV